MSNWISTLVLLAEQGGEAAEEQGGGSPFSMLVPMLAIGALWYFLLIHPQRKEKAQREDRLKTLKKNDRVVTIGGLIGTIANIEPDGREVTIKVDENTRLRFLRTSIQTVLTDEKKNGDDSGK